MQHLERFITYNSCMLSHSLAEPRSCRTSLSIDCTSTGILEYFLSSVPPQSVTGPPGTHSLPHPRGWESLMLAPSSSEVGTLLQSHGLCSPRVVHALLNICSHHSSLCFFLFHCPHLSGIHLLSSSTHSSFLNSLLASASAPPQSGVYTWGKASFIKCRSDHTAPQLLRCSGLAGQSKMMLMTLPALAAAYTRCCHFSPAPSPLLPTLCLAMLNLS